MGYGRVLLDSGNNMGSNGWVLASKLICKGGEDVFELLSVKIIPGTEEAGTKESLTGNHP